MGKAKKKVKATNNTIAQNKRARHEYLIGEQFEAGVQLLGWEVKSLRMGKGQLTDTFVLLQNGEAFLLGANIMPLNTASTHVIAEPQRARKLLLNKRELAKIVVATSQKGYTCVPLALYWKGPWVKAKIALVQGKKEHDKRASEKERDWNRDKQRIMSAR